MILHVDTTRHLPSKASVGDGIPCEVDKDSLRWMKETGLPLVDMLWDVGFIFPDDAATITKCEITGNLRPLWVIIDPADQWNLIHLRPYRYHGAVFGASALVTLYIGRGKTRFVCRDAWFDTGPYTFERFPGGGSFSVQPVFWGVGSIEPP